MKSGIILTLSIAWLIPAFSCAQSTTTEALHKKHSNALALFFYTNTLRMLNQDGDKEFDDLIKGIEKMRFLMIKKKRTRNSAALNSKNLLPITSPNPFRRS